MALFVSFVWRILLALFFGVIGLAFASIWNVRLPFSATMRLAVAAMTPVIVVKALLAVAGAHLPYSGAIYLLTTLGYLAFGVHAAARPPQQEEPLTSP